MDGYAPINGSATLNSNKKKIIGILAIVGAAAMLVVVGIAYISVSTTMTDGGGKGDDKKCVPLNSIDKYYDLTATNDFAPHGVSKSDLEDHLEKFIRVQYKTRADVNVQDVSGTFKFPSNNDVNTVPYYTAMYRKSFNKGSDNIVNGTAWRTYLQSVTGNVDAATQIAYAGGTNPGTSSPYQFSLGDRSHYSKYNIPHPPKFHSNQLATEMVEMYWAALIRDVAFTNWSTDPLVAQACAELTSFGADFKGPKNAGVVTPATFLSVGNVWQLPGPRLSQFVFMNLFPVSSGGLASQVIQKVRYFVPGMVSNKIWALNTTDWNQSPAITLHKTGNAAEAGPVRVAAAAARYCTYPRDYMSYMVGGQAAVINTMASLNTIGGSVGPNQLNPNNNGPQPTIPADVPAGDGPFNFAANCFEIMGLASNVRVFSQIWKHTYLRARPEEIGIEVQRTLGLVTPAGIAAAIGGGFPGAFAPSAVYTNPLLLLSQALNLTYAAQSSYFLSTSSQFGCPADPAYPSGHLTSTTMMWTIFKALINHTGTLPCQQPDPATNFTTLASCTLFGGPATVNAHDEINKWIANAAMHRMLVAIHYRSDVEESIATVEQVAIDFLKDYALTVRNALPTSTNLSGFRFKLFNGTLYDVLIPGPIDP